jgi:Tfp pilus assembly protein PilV
MVALVLLVPGVLGLCLMRTARRRHSAPSPVQRALQMMNYVEGFARKKRSRLHTEMKQK